MKNETIGFIEIIIAALLMGFVPIVVRFGENLGPYNLSFFRIFVAAITLGVYFLIFKGKLSPLRYEKKKMFLFGAIHGFIILGYFVAIQFLTVASAVLLLYSSSIWIVVFSHFILKEKLTKQTIFALLIAIVGVFLVLPPSNFLAKGSLIGSLAGILAGIGFGLVYVLSKTFNHYNKTSLTFWQNLIAIPFLAPVLFFDFPKFTGIDISLILILGIFLTVIPFVLIYRGFQKIPAQKGGVLILLDIIFPILIALAFFGEIPSLWEIVGGSLIFVGAILAMR